MNEQKRTLYQILGVPSTATLDEIRQQYRTLAKKYHPDANADTPEERVWTTQRMTEVNEAYEVLKDAGKRSQYDWQQRVFIPPPSPPEPNPWPSSPPWQSTQEVHLLRLYQCALTFFQDMKWQEALNIFAQIGQTNPRYRDVAGRVEKIHQILAHEAQEDTLAQYYEQGLDHLRAERWTEAEAAFEFLYQLAPHYEDGALRLEEAKEQGRLAQTYEEATRAMTNKRWLEAIVHLEAILAQTPAYREAAQYLQTAQDHYRAIYAEDAGEDQSSWPASGPAPSVQTDQDIPRRVIQAQARATQGNSDHNTQIIDGEEQPDKADNHAPGLHDGPQSESVQSKSGQSEEVRAGLSAKDDMLSALLKQGLALYARREFERAKQKFRAALYHNSDDADAHACLAWVYLREGLIEAAVDHCRTALRLDSRCVRAYMGQGDIYQQQGHLQKAARAYRQALEIEPNWAWIHRKLAELYAERGLYNEATHEYQAAITLSSESEEIAQIYDKLGQVFVYQEKLNEATEAYWTAIKLDSHFGRPLVALGQLYERRGLKHRAQTAYHRFLQTSQALSETKQRRWVVWRLGVAYSWPMHHWLWCTVIWLPLLCLGAFYSVSQEMAFQEMWPNIYLPFTLITALAGGWLGTVGLAYLTKLPRKDETGPKADKTSPQLDEVMRWTIYGATYVGSGFVGLLLAFIFALESLRWPMFVTAIIMLLIAVKILYEERHLAYQLSLGVAIGLLMGALIDASLNYAQTLLERFVWAVIFLTFGGAGMMILVGLWLWLSQWLADVLVVRYLSPHDRERGLRL